MPFIEGIVHQHYSNETPQITAMNLGDSQIHKLDQHHELMMKTDEEMKPKMMMIMSKGKLIKLKPPLPTKTKRSYTKSKKPILRGQVSITSMLQTDSRSKEPRLGHKSPNNVKTNQNPITQALQTLDTSKIERLIYKKESSSAQGDQPKGGNQGE